MKVEKKFQADKKITILFFIVIITGITLSVSNKPKVEMDDRPGSQPDYEKGEITRGIAPDSTPPGERRLPSHTGWGRDPFLSVRASDREKGSATVKKRRTPQLVLSAILIDGDVRAAVIDGTVCRRGQIIRGYAVEEIARGTVTLRKGSKKVVLKL